MIKTLRPLKSNSTLKSGFLAVSLCQDLSNSDLSTSLLSSAMNLCIATIPRGGCLHPPSFEIPA